MLTYASRSNKGDRSINEDCVDAVQTEDISFFVLADGLGGHGRGEVASGLAVTYATKAFRSDACCDMSAFFTNGQDAILDTQRTESAVDEMKTTLVCLRISGSDADWGHVGDSRLYHFEKGKLTERTKDHSVPQMLVSIGEIREKDIRKHPDRNRLLRVLGTEWDTPKYELSQAVLRGGDAFLLCSDGFWEWITEKDMEKCLRKSQTPELWMARMEEIVLKAGANANMDNYSAITVFV